MYLVIAKTGNNVYTLHDVRENATAKKLKSGSVTKGINAIDSFTFSIYQNNPAYENLIAYKTQIEVYNAKTLTLEYSGRVLLVKTEMEENGLIYKDVTCESVMGYLCDSVQPYEVERNWTLNELLTTVINNHNEQVEAHKKFYLGEITMEAPNDNIYIGIQRETSLETLNKKLIEKIGGEIAYRIADGKIYLDYKPQIGSRKDTTIALAKNMKSASVEIDPTAFVTRLIPLGAKVEVAEGEAETEERIGIESVNNGVAYIEDTAGVAMYGIITKYEIFDDVHEPAILKTKAQNYIAEVNKVLRKYTINAVDLSLIDLDIDSFEVGNYYPVINKLMGIDEELRVVKKSIDIINFTTSSFEIGDTYKTLSDLQKEQEKAIADRLQNAENKFEAVEKLEQDTSNASTLAERARAEAEQATLMANEAKEASDDAKEIAGTAINRADNAISTANTAKNTAETASQTATDAKNDAEQAQRDIDGLGEELATLESTMTAEYARKTDVTEARAELQTQITQNAESITQTASRVTEIDETANNSLELAEQAKNEAELAQSKADLATAGANEAQTVANTAKSTAEQAQTNATNAKNIAEQAQTDATNANTKAEQAQEDAETAKTNATNAQTVANTAKTTAESATAKATTAQTKAEQAQADLETAQAELAEVSSKADATAEELETAKTAVATAQSKADTAKAEAEQAQADANTAKANALTAQEEADKAKADAEKAVADASTAKANAEQAQTVANNAKLEAENAQTVADTAKANAEQAQTVANLAKTASENAQAEAEEAKAQAEQAQADANALKTRVETAETKIEQNSQQLLLMATKAELEETLGGYFTKEETTAQIKLESDSIKSTVSSTYATKTALSTTDTKATNAQTVANNAKAEAEQAIADAENAQTVAGTAQSTANTAKSTADNAKSTADTAKSTANTAKTTADNAKTTAEATAEELENLEIGGVNLILGTSQEEIALGGYPDTSYTEGKTYKSKEILTGDKYVLSFDAKSTVSGDKMRCHFYNPNTIVKVISSQGHTSSVSDGNCDFTITDSWQRYWVIYEQTPNTDTKEKSIIVGRRMAGAGTGEIAIKGVKLEAGNKATDWSPAPEDTAEAIGGLETRTTFAESQIEQLPASIRAEVREEYTQKSETEELRSSMQTMFKQHSDEFVMKFTDIMEQITTVDGKVESNYQELIDYIRFVDGNIILGQVNNPLSLMLQKDRISFMQGESEVAYMSNNKMYIFDGEFLNSLVIGNFEFVPRANGNLSFRKRGGN